MVRCPLQQTFFYKHVGTYLTVTPRIINWGTHGEGQGEAPIRWQHFKIGYALVAIDDARKAF